jgi:hypothetical protein
MTTQKRAKVGGEVGTNGEFYEGGKFLPSTTQPKRAGSRPRGPRKQQIEPFVWVVAEDGRRAIFGAIVGTQAQYIDRYNPDAGVMPFEPAVAHYGPDCFGVPVAELCERYNRGERWF